MEKVEEYNYSLPVAQLLTLGKPEVSEADDWSNYLDLGLNAEHIPDLIRMATDEQLYQVDEENPVLWASYHAWRTLGQLRAEAAIEPLLSLYQTQEDNEWVMEELPVVYSMIGQSALPVLTRFIADHSIGEWPRIHAITSIEMIGKTSSQASVAAREILSKQLAAFQTDEREFNAFLIGSLIKLEAKETVSLIERAFAADAVDVSIVGEWVDVQEAFGLLSPEELEQLQQRRAAQPLFPLFQPTEKPVSRISSVSQSQDTAYQKEKRKRKLAKQARKKNHKH